MPVCRESTAAPEEATDFEAAVAALRRGGAVVYPTETFYGLGVDATNRVALERLVQIKGRPHGKPISVLISDRDMLAQLVRDIPRPAAALMDRFWPGPLTLVLPALPSVSECLTGGTGTIGVRWSSHALATALVGAVNRPITAPSANPSGAEPPVTVEQARAYFGDAVDTYVDGGTLPGGLGSTVVQLIPVPRVLRQGVIPAASILATLRESDEE